MRILFCLLCFSTIVWAQKPVLELQMDNVKVTDTLSNHRKFTISYHIENLSDNQVSFYLDTKSIGSQATASLSYKPFYKIFQGNEYLNFEGIFNTREDKIYSEKSLLDFEHKMDSIFQAYQKSGGTNEDKFWVFSNQQLKASVITLQPKEKKGFSTTLIWNKKRYFKYFDNEFYLDEKEKHFIELSINLMKEELKAKLSADEFQAIQNDKSFIKGWFTSNRVAIDFGQ